MWALSEMLDNAKEAIFILVCQSIRTWPTNFANAL
jgi:hypothetical protein